MNNIVINAKSIVFLLALLAVTASCSVVDVSKYADNKPPLMFFHILAGRPSVGELFKTGKVS